LKKPLPAFLSSILPDLPLLKVSARRTSIQGAFQRRHPQGTRSLKTLQDDLKTSSGFGDEPVAGRSFDPDHLSKRFSFTGKPDLKKTYKINRE
jgi:hypothetical protein